MDKRIDVKGQSGAVETHTVSQSTQNATIQIHNGSEIRLFGTQGDIESMQREGHDLIVKYTDGTVVRLASYFDCPTDAIPSLVLDDQSDAGGAEHLYKANLDPAACFAADDVSGGVVAFSWVAVGTDAGTGLLIPILGGLAVLGAGIGAAVASGGGDSDIHPASPGAPNATKPEMPTGHFNADGTAFIGHGQPNATIVVADLSGKTLGVGTADDQGNYTVPLSEPQNNGQQVEVSQITPDGSSSGTTTATAPDLSAPEVPAIHAVTDDVGAVTGSIPSGGVTDDATPTLSGTAEANSTVTISDNGTVIGTATADASGNWTFTATALGDGAHSFTTTATDAAGNTSAASPAYDLTVDTTAPSAPTVNPTDGADGSVLSGTAEAGASVAIDTNGDGQPDYTTTAGSDGSWSVPLTAEVPDGTAISVTVTDPAGNASAPTTVTVDAGGADTTPPDAPVIGSATDDAGAVTGPVASGGSTDDTTPTLSGTAEANSTVTISDNGTVIGTATADASGNWSFTPGTALGDGAHSFTTTATDAAGNTSAASPAYDLTVVTNDTLQAVPDTVTLDGGSVTAVAQPAVTTDNVQVLGIAEGANGTDGSQSFTIAANSSGTVHIEITQTSLVTVADAYQIDVVDANGNVVYSATSNGQLLGGVGTANVLGITGNNTLTADVGGLPPGTYHVVVHNSDQSTLVNLLDSDGSGGVSLTELGDSGVVIGPDNEALILSTVGNALDGTVLGVPLGNLGSTIVVPLLQLVLDGIVNNVAQETPVSALVGLIGDVLSDNTVTTVLAPLGLDLGALLDSVISTLSSTLLANTLSILQHTSITTQYTGNEFATGDVTGNVITDPAGADHPGSVGSVTVTQVTWGTTTVAVDANNGATIQGEYGSLHIDANGTYTYTASGDPAAFGHSDTFTYTISDGVDAASTTLTVNIVDTVAPVATPTITGISEDTGTVGDWTTTDTSPAILGKLDQPLAQGEKVQVSIDGGTWTDATIDKSDSSATSWFFGPGALSGGSHTVSVQIVDQSGNVDAHTASQVITIDTDNQQPIVAINNGTLGGVLGLDLLGLADIGNQTFIAYDPDNNLKSVSVEYSVPAGLGQFDLTASQELAAELGLQFSVAHDDFSLFPSNPESSTLTITSLTPGASIDNQAMLELLDSVYLDTGLSINVIPTYTITATDMDGLSATTSTTSLADLGLGTSMSSSILLGTTGNDTINGTSADEHLYGFGGNDTIHGNDGNDLIRGGAGADSLYGDNGNDVLVYDANDIVIDGGDGNDTLLIEDAVATIVGNATPVHNIENIQLGADNAAHSLTLDAAGAAKATGTGSQLTINGSANDTVNLTGGVFHGQVLSNGHVYETYSLGTTTLLIQDHIHVNVTPV